MNHQQRPTQDLNRKRPTLAKQKTKPRLNIVWFKRDLRLTDHPPLTQALTSGNTPTLLLYIFEPELVDDPHYSLRHWRFVWQSLQCLNHALAKFGHQMLIVSQSALTVFERLHQHYHIAAVYSHQEIGLAITYQRDQTLHAWFKERAIAWHESPSGAVIRGAANRAGWQQHWQRQMRAPILTVPLRAEALCTIDADSLGLRSPKEPSWQLAEKGFQTGGSDLGWQTLQDFFTRRGANYYCSLSSPTKARSACTRLSPYLAWGCLSLREVYQALLNHWQQPGFRRSAQALASRLHWHCHFIQKFESEHHMEHRCVNRGYEPLLGTMPTPPNQAQQLNAWKSGTTGIPLVDACMRCLIHTGYLNFRMRAMLVSFLTHHMALDWRLGVTHLAQLFLDFEPGIHYAQFQMQAGVIGVNTIRIYNPVKQAQEHDPNGQFVYRWLPELAQVPTPLLFEPWKMTAMEANMYEMDANSRYLAPIIDIEDAARQARTRLWSWKSDAQVQREATRILKRHVKSTDRSSQ